MAINTTYFVTKESHSSSPDATGVFVVRMLLDFSKHNAGTANTEFVGPELEEGVMPIQAWSNVITTGDGTVAISGGYTSEGTEWFDAQTIANSDAVAAITLNGSGEVPAQSNATKQYLRLWTDDTAETAMIVEIILLCVKTLESSQARN